MKQAYVFWEDLFMSKWKKAVLLVLSVVLLLSALPIAGGAENDVAPPSVAAQSAVLIEAESGEVVWSKNMHAVLPMASTTKTMTALVALELASPDTVITVDAAAVGVEGSSVYLCEGEQLTLEELLYALMLESANDAAVAIAIGLSGSVEAFADEMNRKVAEMGLLSTHFVNPHGLDDDAHFTSAYELALIAREALKNDLLREIVSTRRKTIPHASADSTRLLVNHNKLLRTYEDCIGVKTGFTKHSGRCLISAAERDGVRLIAVTLNDPDDWKDHTALLDYGFTQYRSVTLTETDGTQYSLSVVGGTAESVLLSVRERLSVTLPVGHGEIRCVIEAPRFAYAPVQNGEILGRAVFLCDTDGDGKEETVGECELIACKTVEKKQTKRTFWQWLRSLFGLD